MNRCVVHKCARAATTRGWCNIHYQRWYRLGNPEAGGPLVGRNVGVCKVHGCHQPSRKRGWCQGHYSRWLKTGSIGDWPLKPRNSGRPDERFKGFLERCDVGCRWRWKGKMMPNGYGQISVAGKWIYAHRWAYEYFTGKQIPAGLDIDHTCHNADPSCPGGPTCAHRRCVYPPHLEPVLPAVNRQRGRDRLALVARAEARP